MAERPPIVATGRVVETLESGRLYRVEMPNGYRVYAIVACNGPRIPEDEDAANRDVVLHFSPFDMSKCRIVNWLP